jgi:hypothetical protein
MASCRSCNAPIIWAISERSGKPIPLDAAPVADGHGRFAIIRGVARAYIAEDARLGRDRYVSHFSTCPDAERFRRGGGDDASTRDD